MAKKKGQAPKSCNDCERWTEVRNRVRIAQSLEKVMDKIEGEIAAGTFKPTIGDYLKLMQLEKEFGEQEAKEIEVKWVESTETESQSSGE